MKTVSSIRKRFSFSAVPDLAFGGLHSHDNGDPSSFFENNLKEFIQDVKLFLGFVNPKDSDLQDRGMGRPSDP
jgi:hypothetical protein